MNACVVAFQIGLLLGNASQSDPVRGEVRSNSREMASKEDFFEMSIEELMEVEIESTASLTGTSVRLAPGAVTTITQDQIRASSARSLFELLDIYVPNLQWIRQHQEADHLGLRGIVSDRDDKYLLLVNGRVMNERTHYGALSERDLVMLGDIHHIDIVRGPGSAMYGPGAVSMVINIVTDNARTFTGTEITSRAGAVEEFYSGEYKHGRYSAQDDAGLFLYFGVGKYLGADEYDAPVTHSIASRESDGPGEPGEGPGSPPPDPGGPPPAGLADLSINRDGETHRHLPPMKLHVEATQGNWAIWGRYTRGGQQLTPDASATIFSPPSGQETESVGGYPYSWGYQQATGYVGYKKELREDLSLEAAFSYDLLDMERVLNGTLRDAHREDELYAKVLLHWDVAPGHRLAFGSEFSHEEFGLPSLGWPDGDAVSSVLGDPMPRWDTDMASILGEYQWTIHERWTTFLGARLDDHTYNHGMFSPRAALVHTPTDRDTWKLLWSRSIRANFAEETKSADLDGVSSKPEKLDSVELRFERRQNRWLDWAASAFVHYDLELLNWSGRHVVPVGTQREWGLEAEAVYHTDRTRISVSHGFTKLYDFDLEPGMIPLTTVEPLGYGDDLTNWSNHVTKIVGHRQLDDEWTLDGSLRIYWGFPGLESYNDYLLSTGEGPTAAESDWDAGSRGNYYLNSGLQYQPNKAITIRLDGYYLLGMFDRDLDKRNYYGWTSDYRSHASGIALGLTYRF